MIKEEELLDAIAECQGERNPNANTCIKLAAYYTILNSMRGVQVDTPAYSRASEPTEIVEFRSGSEFSDVIDGKDVRDVMAVIDELMETVEVLIPKLYRATIDKLKSY